MARGDYGRIVLEIDPSQKDDLYAAITKDGLTLKSWFLQQADKYLRERVQLPLFAAEPDLKDEYLKLANTNKNGTTERK